MTTRTIKTALTALACVVLLGAGTYIFRESLLRAGINAYLAGDTAVTRLQGVQLSSTHAGIDELELSLGPSGQQLTVADIELTFNMPGLLSMPVMESLVVGSARLTNSAGLDDVVVPADSVDSQQNSALLLSELLQQLRNFPFTKMALNTLELPQFRQKLALNVAQQTDALELSITSGALRLLATFMQPNADTTAQIMLSLDADGVTVAEADLSLQPQASGYQLAGSGKVEFSDANTPFAAYLTTPLPLSSVAFAWNLAALVPDELLNDPASSISLNVLPEAKIILRDGVVPGLGELAVVSTDRAELSLAPGAEMSIATGKIPLSLMGSWQEQPLQSAVLLTPSTCHIGGARACNVGFDGTASLAAYTITGADPAAATTISALAFSGSGSAKIDNELVAVVLNPGSRFGSGTVMAPAFSISSLSAASDATFEVRSSIVDQQLSISGTQMSLMLAELKVGEYQVSADFSVRDINLVSAEKLAGKMQVQTAGLAVTGPQWIPAIGFDTEINIDGDMFNFSTPLLLPNAPADVQLQASGSYNLVAGTGEINMKLPTLTLTGQGNSLSSYLSGWPYPADVMTGTLALDLNVQLRPGSIDTQAAGVDAAHDMTLTGKTKIVLTDVAGFYAENFFKGLNTTIEAAYDSSALSLPVTTPPLSLTLDELDVGMPITDISLNYQLDASSQIVNVSSIFGKLLDGTVSGMDINYDFSKERNDMVLMFSGLRLERMLDLADYDGIEAVGAVSGELPVSITGTKVKVDAGKLYAEVPGGSIRYLAAPPAGQGNPAMDFVNQALSNYQFQSLESTINYTPDGELLLGMQLRGHNPDMNGGQAINLNLNISDNIPTLLKSLQAGRRIEDFLQEQYK